MLHDNLWGLKGLGKTNVDTTYYGHILIRKEVIKLMLSVSFCLYTAHVGCFFIFFIQ